MSERKVADMTERVMQMGEAQSRAAIVGRATRNGLSVSWLDEMARTEGYEWVGDWLEAHNFDGLAEDWRSAVFLHQWEPLHRPTDL